MADQTNSGWAVSQREKQATCDAYGISLDELESFQAKHDGRIPTGSHEVEREKHAGGPGGDVLARELSRTSSQQNLTTLTRTATYTTTHTTLFDEDGQIRLIPMPTADPKDPLNMPTWRKVVGILFLCAFAALTVAAEIIIGALCPIFVIIYAGFDASFLDNLQFQRGAQIGANIIEAFQGLCPYPIWEVYLIASLPVLVLGVSDFVLVPMAIACGRRPVLLVSGVLAIAGGIWAGFTNDLYTHLAARSLQGIGIGTVETLIPIIMADMTFIHNRNTALSGIWCGQGIIIVGFGMFSPWILVVTSWRWIYWMTAIGAGISYIGIIFFVPETRYKRTEQELRGDSIEPLPKGQNRPVLDYARYGGETFNSRYGFQKDYWWREAWRCLVAVGHTIWFPNMLYLTILNAAFIAMLLSIGQAAAPVFLAFGWRFRYLGFSVVAIVIAAVAAAITHGWGADKVANWFSKKYLKGQRHAEVHVLSMIWPLISTCIGVILFGYSAEYAAKLHWIVCLISIFFIAYGVIAINIVGTVYVLESYPEWAGPVLINISSVRNIIAFACSFKTIDWILGLGYMNLFGMWCGIMAALGIIGLPVLYYYGRTWRRMVQVHIDRVGPIAVNGT